VASIIAFLNISRNLLVDPWFVRFEFERVADVDSLGAFIALLLGFFFL
jgi:hypothetical protein